MGIYKHVSANSTVNWWSLHGDSSGLGPFGIQGPCRLLRGALYRFGSATPAVRKGASCFKRRRPVGFVGGSS